MLVNHKDYYLESPYLEDLAAGKLLIHDLEYVSFEDQSKENFYKFIPYDINIDEVDLDSNPSVWCYRIGKRPELFEYIHKLVLNQNNI